MQLAYFVTGSLQRYMLANSRTWISSCRFNSNTAMMSRIKRPVYAKKYSTVLVNPDGSSYTIRYNKEPRQIIFLPLDFDSLSEQRQLQVLASRKPQQKATNRKQNLDGDTFDPSSYLNNFKRL